MINSVFTLSAEGDVAITPVTHVLEHTPNGIWGEYTIKYTIPQDLKIITWGEYEELQDWDQDARKLFYELYEGGFEL